MMTKEAKPDSVIHTEERHARLKAESERLAREEVKAEADRQEKQAVRDMKADDDRATVLENQANLLSDLGSRDQLLEQVRKMRDDTPENSPPAPPPLSESMRQRLELEQNAGREAVRKAEEEYKRNREARDSAEAEKKAYEGHMETVHHPNPGQNEMFPANKATLGKAK